MVLDDVKDSIANSWLKPAGLSGIPAAFLVDEKGLISWIGHPGSLEPVLAQVAAKKWNMKAGKSANDARVAYQAQKTDLQKKIGEWVKAGDMKSIGTYMKSGQQGVGHVVEFTTVLNVAMHEYPDFTVEFVKQFAKDCPDFGPDMLIQLLSTLAGTAKQPGSKSEVLKMSNEYVANVPRNGAAMAYLMHARTLNFCGDTAGAKAWLGKARNALNDYDQKMSSKDSVLTWITDLDKTLKVRNP